jgi:hypothetical protein
MLQRPWTCPARDCRQQESDWGRERSRPKTRQQQQQRHIKNNATTAATTNNKTKETSPT